jgi:hypothetical protein
MNGWWILSALLGAAGYFAGRQAVSLTTRRAMRTPEAEVEGSWQYGVRQQMLKNGARFQASVHFTITAGVIGLGIAVGAVVAAVPIWLGILGLAMVVFAPVDIEARIRYGTGKFADRARVIRSWLP